MMDLAYFEAEYNSTDRTADELEQMWDDKAEDYNQIAIASEEAKQKLVQTFLAKKLITQESSVLDLGCGPGVLSALLAPHVKQVVGCDISGQMLDHARHNTAGLANVALHKIDWWAADIDSLGFRRRFDLVIANMTPSIHNVKTLYKFMDCSKEHCFLSTFARRSSNLSRELSALTGKKQNWQGVHDLLNILWLRGQYPEIWYREWANNREIPVEHAQKILGREYSCSSEALEKLLDQHSQDGKICEHIESLQANLLWKV